MKKLTLTVIASLIPLSFASATDKSEAIEQLDDIQAKITKSREAIASADEKSVDTIIAELKTELSNAELLTYATPTASEAGKFHGRFGTNIEIEQVRRDDGVKEGKLKYTLVDGNFRHDDLPGWDFGFYSGREELYNGNLKHADYSRGVNSIQEIYTNRSYNFNWGSLGWGAKLKGESGDKRTVPEAKVFGTYKITDALDLHGYALYHVEYKRNTGEFPFWEVEPGLGYKIDDNTGMWLNLRFQEGRWKAKEGGGDKEPEQIIKPGVWHNFGDLSASLWAEIGQLKKSDRYTGKRTWTEKYNKFGVSANYPLTKHWRAFGELSYKDIKFEDHKKQEKFDGYITVGILGVNYNF